MKDVVFQVRSRLLDFMLDLKESFGSAKTEEAIKENVADVDMKALLARALNGQNTTIIFGDYHSQTITNNVVPGNFESLAARLENLGVERSAVEDLRHEIAHKEPEPKIRERVVGWIRRQTEQQLDAGAKAAVTISIDAVVHAVMAYFG